MAESVQVRILFFAKSRELSGLNQCNLEIPPKSLCSELINYICSRFNLNIIKSNVIVALNGEYCDNLDAVLELKNGDEIAHFKTTTMNYLKLTESKLDLNEISELVFHESCGGVSFFVGTTRDSFEEKTVVSLEYEAYDTMAIQTLTKICYQMRSSWTDIKNIAIYHRLGLVPVKEASVIIGVSSPHRKTSLDAVQYAIEELKKTVPIWKKEQYGDPAASSVWKENKECNWSKDNLNTSRE